jgi:DNA polymerase-3 subunit epsilon
MAPRPDWTRKPLIGFDLETTGVDLASARIVTGAVVRWGGGMPTVPLTWLSDVGGMDIPDDAAGIHGITTEVARSAGRPAAEVVTAITAALAGYAAQGLPLVAMSASFDFTILERECERYGVRSLWGRSTDWGRSTPVVLDPRVLDKRVDRYRKGPRNLGALATHWCVKVTGTPHQAETDARTACGVVHAIGRRYLWLAHRSLGDLHEDQAVWAREQTASLRAHLARTGGDVDTGLYDWPFIPAPRPGDPR